MIDSAVERRRMVSAVLYDPVVVRFLGQHEPFRQLMTRLYVVLTGGDPGVDARVRAAMVSAAIGGAVMHPLVMDLDDETLRSQLADPDPTAHRAPGLNVTNANGLAELLDLEVLDRDLFRGQNEASAVARFSLYGGQVAAQALTRRGRHGGAGPAPALLARLLPCGRVSSTAR